jgi:hypothetical protein
LDTYWKKEKRETRNKMKKAYSERWHNVVYEMETRRSDFVGDRVSKDVATRHRTTTIQYSSREMLLVPAVVHVDCTHDRRAQEVAARPLQAEL